MGGIVLAEVSIRPGETADGPVCAAIVNDWIDATPWLPRVHSPKAVERHYIGHVLATCRVQVAEVLGALAGFIAVDREGYVAAVFVARGRRGQGVGTALVAAAKTSRPEGLSLWTFEANAAARAFYAARGFKEAGGTAGDNDEGLPDLRFVWPS